MSGEGKFVGCVPYQVGPTGLEKIWADMVTTYKQVMRKEERQL